MPLKIERERERSSTNPKVAQWPATIQPNYVYSFVEVGCSQAILTWRRSQEATCTKAVIPSCSPPPSPQSPSSPSRKYSGLLPESPFPRHLFDGGRNRLLATRYTIYHGSRDSLQTMERPCSLQDSSPLHCDNVLCVMQESHATWRGD